ncbi:MAG: sugar nucleotide-binding protein [Candidatus Magasanikbacteria bacterium]|nr:sugar nucleotide-binding protein [Candidatus Magasanikbacteria bacterium]
MNAKRILITGNGQLGSYYRDHYTQKGAEVLNIDSKTDIRDEAVIRRVFVDFNPDLVIHTAAKTNIDWAEQHKTECFEINTLGADIIGKICQENGIYLVFLSSGCVLESKSATDAQTENVVPSPLCFYSWTKVWAEEMLMHRARRNGLQVLVLRPRQLLSAKVDPRNALTKMLTYNKFIDTPNSCTVVEDLMMVTDTLAEQRQTGVFNVVNPGVTTPFEIATALKEIIKPEMDFIKISKEELNKMTLAERVDAVLDGTKLRNLGIELTEIHERMREVMQELKKNLTKGDAVEAMQKTEAETKAKLSLVK